MTLRKLIKHNALILSLIVLFGCEETKRTMEVDGFSVEVVDKVTSRPIEGALVIALFIARSGSHDSTVGLSNGLETLTDANGIAHFPAWTTSGVGFGANDPILVAYKASYMPAQTSTKSTRKWIESVFHVSSISPLSKTNLSLMKCDDTNFKTREQCESKAHSSMPIYVGLATKHTAELPMLKRIIEERRRNTSY